MSERPLPPAGAEPPGPAGDLPPAEPDQPAEPAPAPEISAPPPPTRPPAAASGAGARRGQVWRARLAGASRAAPDWLNRLVSDPVGRVVVAVAAIGVCGLGLLVCVNLAFLLPGTLSGLPFGRTATPEAAPTEAGAGDSLVFSDAVEVPLAVPQTIKFAGQSLPVAVANLDENGVWQLPANQTTTAFWVYGSLVNYVFGLKDTSDNLAAIDALAKGDSIEVQMSDGRALRFQVAQKLRVPANKADIFTQTQPGLTLVLAGSRAETRLVIQAAFVGQSGLPAGAGGGDTFELGTPAQAGDLLVTVTATKLVTFGASELPAGLAYYLVDYVAENTGAGPVEAALVVTELVDPNGSQYAPVIPVSAVTTYPPLAGRINPNDVINASAAYLVPVSFVDTGAIWRFGPGTGGLVQINLTSPAAAGPPVNVTLKTAELNDGKTELRLTGTVVNLGVELVQVTQTDLGLISGTGQTTNLVQAAPPLPWTLEPSAFLSYEVVFARPATSAVIFRMLGWEFELTGVE